MSSLSSPKYLYGSGNFTFPLPYSLGCDPGRHDARNRIAHAETTLGKANLLLEGPALGLANQYPLLKSQSQFHCPGEAVVSRVRIIRKVLSPSGGRQGPLAELNSLSH